jgi:signal transduction histidine kinase
MKKARVSIINLLFLIIVNSALFLEFVNHHNIPLEIRDLIVFSCIDFICSMLVDIIDKRSSASLLFFIKLILINTMAFPFFVQSPYIFSLLLCMFFWELNTYFPFPLNIMYTFLSTGLSIYIILFFMLNGNTFSDVENIETYIALILLIFSLVYSILIKRLSAKIREDQNTIKLQYSAIIDLTKANLNFLNYASFIKQQTIVAERRKLTGELHDIVGHPLTNIISMMDVVIKSPLINPPEQIKLNQWIRDQAQGCLKNTRAALYNLRNLDKDELKGANGLYNLFTTFSFATRIKVNCEWGNVIWNLPYEIEQGIYKTIEEAFINAFKHGKAKEIYVMFWYTGSAITIVVRDDGIGSKTNETGIGQETMKERIGRLGGTIGFSNSEYGYVVSINIPYKKESYGKY